MADSLDQFVGELLADTWDPDLHPRGPDGHFIPKAGNALDRIGDFLDVESDPIDLDPDEQPTDKLQTLAEAVSSDQVAGVPFDADVISSEEIEAPWKDDVEVGFPGSYVWASVNTKTVAGIQASIAQEKGTWDDTGSFFSEVDEPRLESLRSALSGEADPERGGIPPVLIRLGEDGNVKAWQEGRHRAIAAAMEGHERIPVKIQVESGGPGDIPADTDVEAGRSSGLESFLEASLGDAGLLAADPPQPPAAATERQRNLWKELINRAVTERDGLSIEAASVQADWNPAAHPRGPDGKFVERPYDIPDAIRDLATVDIVRELNDEDPEFADKVQDIGIDGVVKPGESVSEALERIEEGEPDVPEPDSIPEEALTELTKTGIEELDEGELVMVDDTPARVVRSNRHFIEYQTESGETVEAPTIDHRISAVDESVLDGDGGTEDLKGTPEGLQPTSDLRIQRAVDDFDEHAANIRDEVGDSLAVAPIEVNDDTYPDGVDFEDGSTLPPRAAAWEIAFEPGVDPDDQVEDLRDQGYLVREKEESESGLFEYMVGVTDETPSPGSDPDSGIPEERLSDPLERYEVDRLDEGDQILVDGDQQGAYITDNPQAITIEDDDGEFVNVDKPVMVQKVAPESSDDQIPAVAGMPDDIAELAQEKIDSSQESFNRFGGDGDFHVADPSEIDWESIEDPHELARNLIDITPVSGMARERDANSHKDRIKQNLNRMENAQAAVQAANRLSSIEQDRSGGSVGWNNFDDKRGGAATMKLKVSSSESTVDHETAHAVVDGNGVAYDVNVHRAKRYNAGNRKVSWEDTLLNAGRDNRELWQYMLTDPDADSDKPPGWDDFSDEIEAQFQDLDDLVEVDDYIRVRNEMGPGPNDSWGETLERGDVVAFDYRGSEETLLIDEVNQDEFDDGTHQVVGSRLPGESEQQLKFDDDGNFHFGDDRSHVSKFGQQVITEEDRNPPEVTDPAEELARPAPEDPDERLQEFHEMANKAWYRQAWASTEPGKADTHKIGTQYSLTNSHETVAKMHEKMSNLKEPDRTAALVKNYAEKHPGFFRTYVQNFGLDAMAVKNIRQVISSDRKFGDGDMADSLETLLEQVEG